ncbi:MAG: hypothetical protein CSA39_02930 [Flavobacteriales bacterium]|nr:MAG: hypothetical protein CR985_00550 [Flavobacteriales bacterium]PIE49376.1 MAG: hypothetical protein CSA39_02930 [Flavobacteriales bacterium]
MKRVIVNFKKLTEDILNMLVEKYPDGYNDEDIIIFKNSAGETIEAVEVRTEDTIYLVKVSVRLEQKMENYILDMEEDADDLPEEGGIDFEDEGLVKEVEEDDED